MHELIFSLRAHNTGHNSCEKNKKRLLLLAIYKDERVYKAKFILLIFVKYKGVCFLKYLYGRLVSGGAFYMREYSMLKASVISSL